MRLSILNHHQRLFILPLILAGCVQNKVSQTTDQPRRTSAPSEYRVSPSAGPDELAAAGAREHPSVIAAEAKVRRLMAKVPQAKALPDPKLRVAGGSMAETAAGRIAWMTGVEQALPFPGKLRAMAAAAGKEAEAAAAELEMTRLRVGEQIRSVYWDYYLASRTTAITEETKAALTQVRDSVDARVTANQADQNDQLRLATEVGKLEQVLINSRQSERSAKVRLNALLNRPGDASLPTPKTSSSGSRGELASLLAKAERSHPSVKSAEAEVAAFQHRLEGARLDRYPDFVVGLQHAAVADSGLAMSANGRDQMFATLGISLPIWQAPRRARIEEASAGIDEASAKIDAARSDLRFRVEDAWVRAKSADELIRLFDKQMLPEAKQAFDSVLTGYSTSTQSFTDVLDAWRSRLGFELQQAGNYAQRGKAMAALKSATGEL
jgi:cobalt-zinc-cadmium efflux system outer membrane protein